MALRRVFVNEIQAGQAVLEGPEAHHLARVVRLKPGEEVEISDGRRLFRASVTDVSPQQVRFAVEQELPAAGPGPEVVLEIALFHFARFEWAIEKATELGVSRIVPVIAERGDSRLAKAAPKRLQRWRRIVEQAAQQSRRMAPPTIDDTLRLDALLRTPSEGPRFVLHPDGEPLADLLAGAAAAQPIRFLVGPEGGWTDAEVVAAERAGYRRAAMGALILRCETAAIAALSLAALLPLGTD